MNPTPAQPNQPQYQTSALNLFLIAATRAAYQQASGQQAPPFDPSKPLKAWRDPAPASDPITYSVFDPNAAPNAAIPGSTGGTGTVTTITMTAATAMAVNLPGVYNYAPYISAPTDAQLVGPQGPIGNVDPATICMQSDAQEIANEIAFLYPGQTIAVIQENTGVFHNVYGSDPRRPWFLAIGVLPPMNAQGLIEAKNSHGVNYPGAWSLASGQPTWTPQTPVTVAPAGAQTLPCPIRPLLPNEQIVHLAGSAFNPLGTWIVERTDLVQITPVPETNDQQFADLKATLAAMQSKLDALAAKQGVV